MDDIKVLLTAVGCPGGVTMIKALKNNGEREITVIGTDMNPNAGGRFFADGFYTVPPASSDEYISAMMDIVEQEQPDVIFPQSSYEVLPLAKSRQWFGGFLDTPIIVGSPRSIEVCNDKGLMYGVMQGTDVPCPDYRICDSYQDVVDSAYELGYPDKPVCLKPTVGKGSRGFHIISDGESLEQAVTLLGAANPRPPQIVMELLEGIEYTVDVFCQDGEILMGFTKTREEIKNGLAMYFETMDRPDLRAYAEVIARELKLDYFADIQFKGNHLLEVNPRVSTFVHQEDFNMPYLGIKYVLGEIGEDELREAEEKVRPTRRSVRYYDQVFYDDYASKSHSR